MAWADRTVRQAHIAPSELTKHPQNWRAHPKHQQAAMVGVLTDIGWLEDILVQESTGIIINGHMRVALALKHHEHTVPVKYVDLSNDEVLEALATIDPIGALATAERESLKGLLEQVQSDEAGVQALLVGLYETNFPEILLPDSEPLPVKELESECLIEIRCSVVTREDIAPVCAEWEKQYGDCTVNIS